jgi:hypothetical protein
LRINSSTVETFLKNFAWDFARYQVTGRQLSELVSQIQSMAAKVDDELKKLSIMFNEKTTIHVNLQRKKVINLITSDFEDFLSPQEVTALDMLKADNEKVLETVMVVVPKALDVGKRILSLIQI